MVFLGKFHRLGDVRWVILHQLWSLAPSPAQLFNGEFLTKSPSLQALIKTQKLQEHFYISLGSYVSNDEFQKI